MAHAAWRCPQAFEEIAERVGEERGSLGEAVDDALWQEAGVLGEQSEENPV
jgi:hypothetical protein